MNRPALWLDFAPGARRTRMLGTGLMLAGLLAGLAALALGQLQWSQRQQVVAGLAALDRSAAKAHTPVAAARPDPVAQARVRATRQVVRNLDTPWSDLLDALSTAPGHGVALLGVEPSAVRRSVRLTVEAADANAMLDYVAALQHDARLASVVLVSHQLQAQAPGTPLRFLVQADWGGKP